MGGTSVLELFVELFAFTDLTEAEAAINEKRLRVGAKKLLRDWD